jgi:hypothetical protein
MNATDPDRLFVVDEHGHYVHAGDGRLTVVYDPKGLPPETPPGFVLTGHFESELSVWTNEYTSRERFDALTRATGPSGRRRRRFELGRGKPARNQPAALRHRRPEPNVKAWRKKAAEKPHGQALSR